MTRQIADYSSEQLYLSGQYKGVFPADFGLWLNCSNVVLYDCTIRSLPPFAYVTDIDSLFDSGVGLFDDAPGLFDEYSTEQLLVSLSTNAVYAIFQYATVDGNVQTVTADTGNIYLYDSIAGSVIGTDYDNPYWSFDNYGDWIFGTNGTDYPIVIKDGVITNPVEYPIKAEDLMIFRGYLIYFGVSADKRTVQWSGFDEPEHIDPINYPTAGSIVSLKTRSGHICARQLSNYIIIYTRSEHFIMEYVGYPNYFGLRDPLPYGVINKRCVASDGARHFCLTESGPYATNGYTVTPIGGDRVSRYYARNADFARKQDFFVVFDKSLNAVRFAFPNKQGTIELLVFYIERGEFLREEYDVSVGIIGVNNKVVFGWHSGEIYETRYDLNVPLTQHSFGVPCYIETKYMSPGNEERRSYFDYIVARMPEWSGNVTLTTKSIGENGNILVGKVTTATDKYGKLVRCPLQRDALYAILRIECSGASWFTISGVRVFGKIARGIL